MDSSGPSAAFFLGGAVLVLVLVIAGIYLARRLRRRTESNRTWKQCQLPDRLLDRVDFLQRKSL